MEDKHRAEMQTEHFEEKNIYEFDHPDVIGERSATLGQREASQRENRTEQGMSLSWRISGGERERYKSLRMIFVGIHWIQSSDSG